MVVSNLPPTHPTRLFHLSPIHFFVGWVEGASLKIKSMVDAVDLPHLNTFWLNPPTVCNRVDGGLADRRHLKIISENGGVESPANPPYATLSPISLQLVYIPVFRLLSPVSFQLSAFSFHLSPPPYGIITFSNWGPVAQRQSRRLITARS
jgi:hypothetical protein